MILLSRLPADQDCWFFNLSASQATFGKIRTGCAVDKVHKIVIQAHPRPFKDIQGSSDIDGLFLTTLCRPVSSCGQLQARGGQSADYLYIGPGRDRAAHAAPMVPPPNSRLARQTPAKCLLCIKYLDSSPRHRLRLLFPCNSSTAAITRGVQIKRISNDNAMQLGTAARLDTDIHTHTHNQKTLAYKVGMHRSPANTTC